MTDGDPWSRRGSDHCSPPGPGEAVDVEALRAACEQQAGRATAGIQDMRSYLSRQITGTAHREVLGPLCRRDSVARGDRFGKRVRCAQAPGAQPYLVFALYRLLAVLAVGL